MTHEKYYGRVAPSINHNQPNWSWDAELICIEQGFRVFSQQEHEDMGMGPLVDLFCNLYMKEQSGGTCGNI